VDTPVVRLGAWCDVVTEEEARQPLLAEAADDGPEDVDARVVPVSGWAALVPRPGVPVLSPGEIRFRVEEFARARPREIR
jgi:hypothetical protein